MKSLRAIYVAESVEERISDEQSKRRDDQKRPEVCDDRGAQEKLVGTVQCKETDRVCLDPFGPDGVTDIGRNDQADDRRTDQG
ncbi:MAG: hypothetical protein V9F03_04075 [Microthrixaceae bacterium]